jgi:hypothetical protein
MLRLTKQWSVACALLILGCLQSDAWAVCVFGSSGEPSLQANFNSLFGLANAPNAVSDCLGDGTGAGRDGAWSTQGNTSATILLELAGFANRNRFGIYDIGNPTNRLEVFDGMAGAGESASLSFTFGPGGVVVTVVRGATSSSTATPFLSEAFGFYLATPQNNVFFSQSNLNPGGADRSYAYRGTGVQFVGGPAAVLGTIFGVNDAILAYEDLLSGDNDFQDFVVLVRGVAPIPIPAAGLLMLSGLGGLALFARRRRAAPRTLAA